MIKKLLFSSLLIASVFQFSKANNQLINLATEIQLDTDSLRNAELDQFYAMISKTVEEGDFEGYKEAYHKDAVIIFASGQNKTSVSISQALAGWKQGFMDTKAGKMKASVEFRFSQRISSEDTAHDTGIFIYTSADSNGKVTGKYITHFEMLMVKRNNKWLALMEYQKGNGTKEEWDALK